MDTYAKEALIYPAFIYIRNLISVEGYFVDSNENYA